MMRVSNTRPPKGAHMALITDNIIADARTMTARQLCEKYPQLEPFMARDLVSRNRGRSGLWSQTWGFAGFGQYGAQFHGHDPTNKWGNAEKQSEARAQEFADELERE